MILNNLYSTNICITEVEKETLRGGKPPENPQNPFYHRKKRILVLLYLIAPFNSFLNYFLTSAIFFSRHFDTKIVKTDQKNKITVMIFFSKIYGNLGSDSHHKKFIKKNLHNFVSFFFSIINYLNKSYQGMLKNC